MRQTDLAELHREYQTLAAQIAVSYNVVRRGSPMTISVMKILSHYPCEQRAIHHLTHLLEEEAEKFDPYFAEKHRFAELKIVERLKNALSRVGKSVAVASEAKALNGIHDVVIMVNGNGVELDNGKCKIIIEIKSGLSLSLEQLERYLWDETTIILCRVPFGQVKVLRARDYEQLIKSGLTDYIGKAERILRGEGLLIPGADCRGCPVKCSYSKRTTIGRSRIIAFSNDDFGIDLEGYLKNLPICLDEVVSAVLKEVEGQSNHSACPSGLAINQSLNEIVFTGDHRI